MLPRIPKWLLLPLFTAWTAACSLVAPHFERPILTVVGIELVGGNLLQQNFLVKFNVQNPNDRALPVTGLHAELNVLGERIASGIVDRAFVVPARGSSQFDMTISANLALVLFKLKASTDKRSDDIDYELTGTANIDLPFLREVPFRQRGVFSLKSLQ
ncbi:MAG TPA: LEA type 2 family protein [Steroidobacteraceae bacterium]|nr:LEA type 2 family protein [Steroidobacteraceae bacterium]